MACWQPPRSTVRSSHQQAHPLRPALHLLLAAGFLLLVGVLPTAAGTDLSALDTWTDQDTANLPDSRSPSYLALCLIVRDQAKDLREWIEHYLSLGAGKVYVFDHASRPPVLPAFTSLAESRHVQYEWITTAMMEPQYPETRQQDGQASAQLWVYHECLRRYGRRHRWMAFFDADEFLILKDPATASLPALLQGYEEHGGLGVNWMVFGTSGHLTRPNVSTLAAYTHCFRLKRIKTIANTQFAWAPDGGPHVFRYRDGRFAVDEALTPLSSSKTDTWAGSKVQLNHYVTKSRAEFRAKMKRGDSNGGKKNKKFMQLMDKYSSSRCEDAVALMAGRPYSRPRLRNRASARLRPGP